MATPAFICSQPGPLCACTFISSTPQAVIAHLESEHSGVALFKRRYGRNAIVGVPIPVILHPVANAPLGLNIFICFTCQQYFGHGREMIEHLLNEPRHSEETATAREEMGDYFFDDAMLAETSRVLTLGAPTVPVLGTPPVTVPAAAQARIPEAPPVLERRPLRSRLMVNFTPPYANAPFTIKLSAATASIPEFSVALQIPYGLERRIDWDTIWSEGLVVRYAGRGGVTGWMVVKNESDVLALVAVMDVGECWVGDGVRG